MEDLATSCFDCNRGKAGIPLETKSAVEDLAEKTALIEERERQVRAYNAAKEQEQQRLDDAFAEWWDFWFELFGAERLEKWYCPWENSLRQYVKEFPPAEIKEAMQLAVDRCGRTAKAPKYFGGVMKRKRLTREGRIARCKYCDGVIELERCEIDDGAWYHVACKPADAE